MSMRCCRDTPRCGDCPVRLKAMRLAATSGEQATDRASSTALLVAEVLAGGPPRSLPGCVADALAQLDAARERRPVPAAI